MYRIAKSAAYLFTFCDFQGMHPVCLEYLCGADISRCVFPVLKCNDILSRVVCNAISEFSGRFAEFRSYFGVLARTAATFPSVARGQPEGAHVIEAICACRIVGGLRMWGRQSTASVFVCSAFQGVSPVRFASTLSGKKR